MGRCGGCFGFYPVVQEGAEDEFKNFNHEIYEKNTKGEKGNLPGQ